ncbi:MAG: hypothetical protein WCQ82_02600 [Bacteroidaceae bacterium]|nr:hypothetical protein [Bacteroidaceae bacterium]
MKKSLSTPQMILLAIAWIVLCFIVLTSAKEINGPVILSVIMSGCLVMIPIYKSFKRKK